MLGGQETAQSYCWTLGVLIDLIFHRRLFYKTHAQILSTTQSYQYEDPESQDVGMVVQNMIVKRKEARIPLEAAYHALGGLVNMQ